MSVLSSDLIPIAVLGASLMGSAHCVGMCGGLALAVGRKKSSAAGYHLGRLTGYLLLGALGGSLGAATIGSDRFGTVSWIASILLALGFFQMGIGLWRGKGTHLFALPQRWIQKLHTFSKGNPFAVGGLSALLPCGWLHGFVLAAIATQKPLSGAVVLFMFWMGTVPALSMTSWLMTRVLGPLGRRMPRASAVLLILAGFASLGVRASPLVRGLLHTGHAAAPQDLICH